MAETVDAEAGERGDLHQMASSGWTNGLTDEGVVMSPPPSHQQPIMDDAPKVNGEPYADLLNFDLGTAQGMVSPPSQGDSKYEFDTTGSDLMSPPPSSLPDDTMSPPPPNNDAILIDLEAVSHDTNIHDASTASVTPQSPPYDLDPFSPLQPIVTESSSTNQIVSDPVVQSSDFGVMSTSYTVSEPTVESNIAFDVFGAPPPVTPQEPEPIQHPPACQEASSVSTEQKVNTTTVMSQQESTTTQETSVTSAFKYDEAHTTEMEVVQHRKEVVTSSVHEAPGAPGPNDGGIPGAMTPPQSPASPNRKSTAIPSPLKDTPGSPRRSAPGGPVKAAQGSPAREAPKKKKVPTATLR